MPVQVQTKQQQQAERKAQVSPEQLLKQFQTPLWRELEVARQDATLTEEQQHVITEYVAAADMFASWTDANPWTWQPPTGYSSRLTSAITWLQGLDPDLGSRRAARETVLTRLRELWAEYRPISDAWVGLRGLWTPDEEFGPLTDKASTLPTWDSGEDGESVAGWECYAGVMAYLNQACGLQLTDLSSYAWAPTTADSKDVR